VSCTASDAAGNSASAGASFDVDQTAPSVSGGLSPSPAASGWWNASTGAPTVSWTCGDATSGLLACSSPSTFADGAGQAATGTATDVAGNIGTATVSGVNVDLTAPTAIVLTGTSLADGATYDFGSVPGAPTGCTATEPVSGLASCNVGGYGAGVGSWSVTAVAVDVAGNTSSTTVHYSVVPWTLSGFDKPIDMAAANDLRAGGSALLKFAVDGGSTDLSTVVVVTGIDQVLVVCPSPTRGPNGGGPNGHGGNQAAARKAGTSFSARWQAPDQPGTCWLVTLRTADGSSLSAVFRLR
jgi:hypothetical protein